MSDHEQVAEWCDAPLDAASISAGRCEGCGHVAIFFRAADGTVFAQGHLNGEHVKQMIALLQAWQTQ